MKELKGFHPIYEQFGLVEHNIDEVRKEIGWHGKTILFFGYVRPYKGLNTLINAMWYLKDYDVKLIIAGEFWGDEYESTIKTIERMNVQDKIIIIKDYIPDDQVGKYFLISDALILPYHSGTGSGPLMTAYAFGKPVISSSEPGFTEYIFEGFSGLTYKNNNPEALANKIKQFYESDTDWESNVTKLRKFFTWERYVGIINKGIIKED